MTFDIPHMIATALIVFLPIWLVDHASVFEDMTKARKTLIKLVAIFVAVFILNIVWPYGAGMPSGDL
jgi:hypothetical protein